MLLILIIAQWLAITVLLLVLMAALIFFIYKRCRLRRLTEDDAKAFETFKEVYKSHAEVFKACFNLTKRLMVESMRFFECVVHTETLRENALPEELWDFTLKFLTEAEEDQRLLGDAAQSKAYARFQKMNHLDRLGTCSESTKDDRNSANEDMQSYPRVQCLSVWYVYMRPQLLERANRRFENFFQQLHYGFDYGTYLQEDGMLEEREPLRRRLKGSLSASTLCLEEEKFQRLLDILSFFMSRTLFATNQMANICLLQSSLSLLTGRLYINRLLSKKHILCSIMFMNSVIDQLRSQAAWAVQEIKEISLTGWQRARRKMRTSHWANTRPLDNFRMAMQVPKADWSAADWIKVQL
eukprot:Skav205349  [mRNA]  locus=scaffold418:59224:74718:- [translate_table: standard]